MLAKPRQLHSGRCCISTQLDQYTSGRRPSMIFMPASEGQVLGSKSAGPPGCDKLPWPLRNMSLKCWQMPCNFMFSMISISIWSGLGNSCGEGAQHIICTIYRLALGMHAYTEYTWTRFSGPCRSTKPQRKHPKTHWASARVLDQAGFLHRAHAPSVASM